MKHNTSVKSRNNWLGVNSIYLHSFIFVFSETTRILRVHIKMISKISVKDIATADNRKSLEYFVKKMVQMFLDVSNKTGQKMNQKHLFQLRILYRSTQKNSLS